MWTAPHSWPGACRDAPRSSILPPRPGEVWPDHREVLAEMAVEVLVRPAEALGIEPLLRRHGARCIEEPPPPFLEEGEQLANRRAPAEPDINVVPGVDALRGKLGPAAGSTVLLEHRDGLVEPAGHVTDVIGQAPAGRHVTPGPGVLGDPADERLPGSMDRSLVPPEAFEIGVQRRGTRLRIGSERVVVGLACPELVGPRLEDAEMVDRVPVEDVVDPAPGRVAPDRG